MKQRVELEVGLTPKPSDILPLEVALVSKPTPNNVLPPGIALISKPTPSDELPAPPNPLKQNHPLGTKYSNIQAYEELSYLNHYEFIADLLDLKKKCHLGSRHLLL